MNKASGGDGIPVELFQILKESSATLNMPENLENFSNGWRKRPLFLPIPKKDNVKECSNYCTIALISQAHKVMLKIPQAWLQQYMSQELPDVQVGFSKGRGARHQVSNIRWIIGKARELQKNIYSALLTMPKPLIVWMTTYCGKFWNRWEYQTTWPASWEICMQVKKQQLELDMEKQTGSKYRKEYVKAVYCHPAYLTYMQSTSWEMLGWMKHKLDQVCWEKYQ